MARDEAYRRAEEKIEEARRTRAEKIDLSTPYDREESEELTELPESLGQLKWLRELDLTNNRLTSLPASLGQLTQMQSLNLSDNQLTVLPECFNKLSQLLSLDLASNQLIGLPKWLCNLKQLQILNIYGNSLRVVPNWLCRLDQLKILQIGGLNLREVPETLRNLKGLKEIRLHNNQLIDIPFWLGELSALKALDLAGNQLTDLPDEINRLQNLIDLDLGYLAGNPLITLPRCIRQLRKLESLSVGCCQIQSLPVWLGELTNLKDLNFRSNLLEDLPSGLGRLNALRQLRLDENPLNPELAAAYDEGLDAVKRYLCAKAEAQVALNEAKLILIGEGEVGKSCLLSALRGDPWVEDRDTTHGIEIKPVKITDQVSRAEFILNGWDFGGQRVYRPTHQLFFSAPAIYLVVWKPREGSQQGFVKEWIKLVKHREPEAKILVVATHGGPGARQPDIDRQELWDIFGKETIADFLHVDSKSGDGIPELKKSISRVAALLPEVGRTFPKHWQEVREKLRASKHAYLALENVFAICKDHKIDEEDACVLIRICHRVGDLIHYEHDPLLKDIVILKPDWLATAISFVLDDKSTREDGHGLIKIERLGALWNDPTRPRENHYPARLHPVFLRLMERFDLSYRIAERADAAAAGASLIAQLVPDVRPGTDLARAWPESLSTGDEQQVQICRIVDTSNNQSATTEGLFYQLIVRLHKYSLGRANFRESVHWQRGLVLQDDTGARAFLEHIGNDVKISVRSPYPPSFLGALTHETKWLVEDFWKGVRCEITVPCLASKENGEPCKGLFEVGKLLENKRRKRPEMPCPICNEWQSVERLLGNAPAARSNPIEEVLANQTEMMKRLDSIRVQVARHDEKTISLFGEVDAQGREIVSKVKAACSDLLHALLDEAKEGPRLFTLQPVDPSFFDRPNWVAQKFRLTFWCERSRQPLPFLNAATGGDMTFGVYEFNIPRNWFVKAAPVLKTIVSIAGLVLPVAFAQLKLSMDEAVYKAMESQLDFGQKSVESVLKGGELMMKDLEGLEGPNIPELKGVTANGAVLRQLHVWLKEQDPAYAKLGLIRVQNKRQEFEWVHPQFEKEY